MIISQQTMRIVFLCIVLFIFESSIAQNTITIAADKGKDTINQNIYGHFAEHPERGIYRKSRTLINMYGSFSHIAIAGGMILHPSFFHH